MSISRHFDHRNPFVSECLEGRTE